MASPKQGTGPQPLAVLTKNIAIAQEGQLVSKDTRTATALQKTAVENMFNILDRRDEPYTTLAHIYKWRSTWFVYPPPVKRKYPTLESRWCHRVATGGSIEQAYARYCMNLERDRQLNKHKASS